MTDQRMKHIAAIDGLRAIAVLTVICFHLNIPVISSGYLGVDVFFVISGYLISAIIFKEISNKTFSIAGFYERRARRILPALFVVLIFTTIAATCLLLPGELVAYAKSLIAASFSYSNIYFWSTANYFDAPAQSKPLLHTWSLAVEEQFYLLFPLTIVFLGKFKKAVVPAVAGAFIVSIALWSYETVKSPNSAFYLPMNRAWELFAGSLLSLELLPKFTDAGIRNAAATLGVLMIGVAAFWPLHDTLIPAFTTVLACFGSVLALAAFRSGPSIMGSMLSFKPIAFVGAISYSAYLWHWPLIVFTKLGVLPILRHGTYELLILALTLFLATLSWRYVENPFRIGRFRSVSRNVIFSAGASGILSLSGVGLIILVNLGFIDRFPSAAISVADLMKARQDARIGTCFITTGNSFDDFKPNACMRLSATKRNYLLIGDSHAAFLWLGLSKSLIDANILQATSSGCLPGIDTPGDDNCRRLMAYVYCSFLASHRVDAVILSGRWHTREAFSELGNSIAWFASHKIKVVVIGPVMEYDAPLPRLLAYAIAFHRPQLPLEHQRNELYAMDRWFKLKAMNDWHVPYISIMDAQCPERLGCDVYADPGNSVAVMFDSEHLSNPASIMLMKKLMARGEFSTLTPRPIMTSTRNNSSLMP